MGRWSCCARLLPDANPRNFAKMPLTASVTVSHPPTPQARYALLAAELQLQRHPRPATAARATAARPASGLSASPDRHPAAAAACWRALSRAGGGSTARLAASVDTTCFASVGSDKGDDEGGPQPLVPTASTGQAGPASGSAIPCTASGPEQGASSSAAAEHPAGDAGAGEPDEAAAVAQEAGAPQYSEQWEAGAAAASEGKECPTAFAQLPPIGAACDKGCPSLVEPGQVPAAGAALAPIKDHSVA